MNRDVHKVVTEWDLESATRDGWEVVERFETDEAFTLNCSAARPAPIVHGAMVMPGQHYQLPQYGSNPNPDVLTFMTQQLGRVTKFRVRKVVEVNEEASKT